MKKKVIYKNLHNFPDKLFKKLKEKKNLRKVIFSKQRFLKIQMLENKILRFW